MSFEDINSVFKYLDHDRNGQISYKEFRLLDEENWRKLSEKELVEMIFKAENSHNIAPMPDSKPIDKLPFFELEKLSSLTNQNFRKPKDVMSISSSMTQ